MTREKRGEGDEATKIGSPNAPHLHRRTETRSSGSNDDGVKMRISGLRYYSFEERIAFQSTKGTLTAEKIREAVARLDSYSAKLAALTAETNKWPTTEPPPSQGAMYNLMHRADVLQGKFKALIAVPEINAAILKREAASK